MLSWIKGFPIGHYIIMAAIGAAMWVYGDLTLTKQALEDERDLREQWQHAAEVQQDIDRRDTIIIRAGEDAERDIQEAVNAKTPVPADIAIPWAAGIDSVRDAGASSTDTKYDMSGPSSREAERTDTDLLGASGIFYRSGAGLLEV